MNEAAHMSLPQLQQTVWFSANSKKLETIQNEVVNHK